MATISKVIRLSQKLRSAEASMSTVCMGYVGRRYQKQLLPNTTGHCIRHFGDSLTKIAAIFKVLQVILETMRQKIVPLVSTYIIYGQYKSDSSLLRASHNCGYNLAGCCCYLL